MAAAPIPTTMEHSGMTIDESHVYIYIYIYVRIYI